LNIAENTLNNIKGNLSREEPSKKIDKSVKSRSVRKEIEEAHKRIIFATENSTLARFSCLGPQAVGSIPFNFISN
jgi:23S rRNA maturation-related 3'-5' exoribonuclease YhaM